MNDHPWAWTGCVLAAASSIFALRQSRRTAARNYYVDEVYRVNPARHRQFAAGSAAAAVIFFGATVLPAIPVVPLLALYTVAAILYFASFVRGASGEDE